MNVTEWSKKSPQGFFGDQRRQATHEHRRVVRVSGGELLAIGPNQVAEDCAGLSMMLPGLLGKNVPGVSILLVGVGRVARKRRISRSSTCFRWDGSVLRRGSRGYADDIF